MKLISMTDLVLQEEKKGMQNTDRHLRFEKILRYAKFLKQPLELWMFVPCDEDGNVLEDCGLIPCYELDQYRQAKERCLFEGFAIKNGLSIFEENSIFHIYWNYDGVWRIAKGLKTIEDLSLYNLQLTPTAIKQLGL